MRALECTAGAHLAIEMLAQRSPLFDSRACLAVIEGVQVPLDRELQDVDLRHLYLLFGGG
jgi:hypothetical protein